MSIVYEFSKIKEAFSKVRNDMNFLADKISENYDEFISNHQKLAKEIELLSNKLRNGIDEIKNSHNMQGSNIDEREIFNLKLEIKDLKSEINSVQKEHDKVSISISDIKKNNKEIKDIKE